MGQAGGERLGLERTFRIIAPHPGRRGPLLWLVLRKRRRAGNCVKAGNQGPAVSGRQKRKEVFRDYEPFIRDTPIRTGYLSGKEGIRAVRGSAVSDAGRMPGYEGSLDSPAGLPLMGTLKKNRFEPSPCPGTGAQGKREAQCFWELSPSGAA